MLTTQTRMEVLEKIAEARSHGDLSENAEYDAAREEQSQLESRIVELENKLAAATILDPKQVKTDRVYILTSVLSGMRMRDGTTRIWEISSAP